ncbi:hypothetical protein QVD17_04299 [Tagetes erecta]|uniref:Uncharacterized protein n=1 Tax=Tagetes erecta TaxID=13708 RepID=A0AAD8LJA6_TARER|nr:hypothetical protein QVD17_04299 [Tagetes erecta]
MPTLTDIYYLFSLKQSNLVLFVLFLFFASLNYHNTTKILMLFSAVHGLVTEAGINWTVYIIWFSAGMVSADCSVV